MAVEDAGIVNGDFLFFASGGMYAFLDEGFGDSRHIADTSIEPEGCVDTVGQQIARDTAACCCCVQPPEAFAALWQICANGPVLQKVGAVVENLSKLA